MLSWSATILYYIEYSALPCGNMFNVFYSFIQTQFLQDKLADSCMCISRGGLCKYYVMHVTQFATQCHTKCHNVTPKVLDKIRERCFIELSVG
jgi:hypothetical protein